ncbi:hypothetical protein [Duganella callida]|uniref:Uncharacterized protein n=1 Tax=Duganella callida TaxID=2561932 RepID=A0A4Y9SA87_9BURK|nr:hypothetical protein [Duganella callida]TFW18856.1 hypothetical protein E4L98_17160 [Duganella callida]
MESVFISKGHLTRVSSSTVASGMNHYSFIEIDETRVDGVQVSNYLDDDLRRCMGEEVEFSFYRKNKNELILAAIKNNAGKIFRDQSLPRMSLIWTEMIICLPIAFICGCIAWLSSFFISLPIMFLLKSLDLSETILGSIAFGPIFLIWGGLFVWVMFFSKKFSQRAAYRYFERARNSL